MEFREGNSRQNCLPWLVTKKHTKCVGICADSVHDVGRLDCSVLLGGRDILLTCSSLSGWTFTEMQQNIPFILSLKRWFIRAYANGLMAELTIIITWEMGIAIGPSLYEPMSSMTWSMESVPQETTNIALMITTVKVTRLRTFNTPCTREITTLLSLYGK